MRTTGYDGSNYQTDFTVPFKYKVLFDNGMKFAYWKSTYGSGRLDPSFLPSIKILKEIGYRTGAYHWEDPTQPFKKQADGFLSAIDQSKVDYALVDFEQHNPWNLITDNLDTTKELPTSQIEDQMYNLVYYLKSRVQVRLGGYSAQWFLDNYAPNMVKKLPENFFVALADYLDYGKQTIVKVTWDQFKQDVPQSDIPKLPKGIKSWLIWQYRTDFLLPTARDGRDTLDLDELNGDITVLDNWIKDGILPYTSTIPIPATTSYKVNTTALFIRNDNNVDAKKIGWLVLGQKVTVLEFATNGWAHLLNPMVGWVNGKYLTRS